MESVSNMLDNSVCLQHVDKQDTPSGTCQHFPHGVNEEEAKNMTEQGCKHCDKTTQRRIKCDKPNFRPRYFLMTSRGGKDQWYVGVWKVQDKVLKHVYISFTFHFISQLQISVSTRHLGQVTSICKSTTRGVCEILVNKYHLPLRKAW